MKKSAEIENRNSTVNIIKLYNKLGIRSSQSWKILMWILIHPFLCA